MLGSDHKLIVYNCIMSDTNEAEKPHGNKDISIQ